MSNILIFYGTTTGNTEVVAQKIADELNAADKSAELKNETEITPKIVNSYDTLIIGSSTWDDGQLQSDMAEFIEKMAAENPSLTDKKVAIFALGDASYPEFCASAELLEQAFKNTNIIKPILKMDGFPDMEENQTQLKIWLKKIIAKL